MNNNRSNEILRKPPWIKIKIPGKKKVSDTKNIISKYGLNTVCKEAGCPNCSECFNRGTATFMILGNICTRDCRFCNVTGGLPEKIDPNEPTNLAKAVVDLSLSHIVITSVTRDDLNDGGAKQFVNCICEIRKRSNATIEILTPDFINCQDLAIEILSKQLPDIFNHNLETVPELYEKIRPKANYATSLNLIKTVKDNFPQVVTKSGIMLGLGETEKQIYEVIEDLSKNGCDMLTLGQYLQPSKNHYPVKEYIHPDKFEEIKEISYQYGFKHIASGPMVRSSYLADRSILSTS